MLMLAPLTLGATSEEPPSSLVPKVEAARVRLQLEQWITRECQAVEDAKAPSCKAREERGPGSTSITLVPVRQPSLKGRHPARTPVSWSVNSGDPDSGKSRELAPGSWRLEWPGYPRQPTFRADAGAELEIKLRVKRGRCEAARRECRLEPSAVERQAEIRPL